METFGIGRAVAELQQGQALMRAGWNGKGMHIALQQPETGSEMTVPYVYIHGSRGQRVPWNCSQEDLLAIDWTLVP